VQVYAHVPAEGKEAEERATRADREAEQRGTYSLEMDVPRGDRLTFHLSVTVPRSTMR
jgi:hypothetical protein